MKKDSLGNRMKEYYENVYRIKLTRRTPVIIRLDGKAFHTLTRRCEKPFDDEFWQAMHLTTWALCSEIQGVKCAYMQSDEISILLSDFDTIRTGAWFDYNLQKMVSISASIASVTFSEAYKKYALFDARAFNVPKEDVKNYFIWRQTDWIRNSVQMLAQAYYSHKQLYKCNQADMHEMLHEKRVNWASLAPHWKNGTFLFKDNDSKFKALYNLVLTRDERPMIGSVFDFLVWTNESFRDRVIEIERSHDNNIKPYLNFEHIK